MLNINGMCEAIESEVGNALRRAYMGGFNCGYSAFKDNKTVMNFRDGTVKPLSINYPPSELALLIANNIIVSLGIRDYKKFTKLADRDTPKSVLVGFRTNPLTVNPYSDYVDMSGFREEEIVIICPHCGYELFAFDSRDFNLKDYQDMDETNFAELFSKRYDLHCQDGSNNFCHRCGQRLLLPNDKNYVCRIDEDW